MLKSDRDSTKSSKATNLLFSDSVSDLEDPKQVEKPERLFIGGFPPRCKEEDLKRYFRNYSSLQEITIAYAANGDSRGFGYVTFGSQKDVARATKGVHKIFGKMFRVKKILSKEDIEEQRNDEMKRKIFLGGLARKTNEIRLEKFLSKFGDIEDILINRNIENGRSKGCAFVLFKDHEVAQKLIQKKNLLKIDGNMVEVKECYAKNKFKQTPATGNFQKQMQDFMATGNIFGNMFSQMMANGGAESGDMMQNMQLFGMLMNQMGQQGQQPGLLNAMGGGFGGFGAQQMVPQVEPADFNKEITSDYKVDYQSRETLMELLKKVRVEGRVLKPNNLRVNFKTSAPISLRTNWF